MSWDTIVVGSGIGGLAAALARQGGRLLDPARHVRTPVPGLLPAGQDVASLGIEGAAMGRLRAAATPTPALRRRVRA